MTSKSAMVPKLVIIEGKEKGKVIPLRNGAAVLGRSKGDILIQDPRISRSHVTIQYDAASGRVEFQDMKSLNGTLLNGIITEKGELKDGDKLTLGNTQLDIQISGPPTLENGSEPKEIPRPKAAAKPVKTKLVKEETTNSPVGSIAPPSRSENTDEALAEELDMIPPRKGKDKSSSSSPKNKNQTARKLAVVVMASVIAVFGLYVVFGNSHGNGSSTKNELARLKKLTADEHLDEALTLSADLQKRYPNDPEILMAVGDAFNAARKTALAISAYQKAHDLPSSPAMVHVQLVKLYLQSGLTKEIDEELRHIDKIIGEGPGEKEFFFETGQLFLNYKELNEPSEKVLILAKALQNKVAPGDLAGYRLEAQLDFQLNQPKDALEALEKGAKIEPDNEWLMENIAFARLALHDLNGATEMLDRWLRLRPHATKALLVLAYLRFNERDYPKAIPFLQKILQIAAETPSEPHHPEALDLLGKIYAAQGETTEAINFFRQGCEAGFQQSCDNPLLKGGAPSQGVAAGGTPMQPPDGARSTTTGAPSNDAQPASVPQSAPSLAPQGRVTPPSPGPSSLPETAPSTNIPLPGKGSPAPANELNPLEKLPPPPPPRAPLTQPPTSVPTAPNPAASAPTTAAPTQNEPPY